MKLDIQQLEFIDSHLRSIAVDIEKHFDVEFEATSLYRIDDPGVHGTLPLRGLDLGCKNQAFGDMVADYINTKWVYDPKRPEKQCCTCHDVGGGLHLHIQTHPNTELRYWG